MIPQLDSHWFISQSFWLLITFTVSCLINKIFIDKHFHIQKQYELHLDLLEQEIDMLQSENKKKLKIIKQNKLILQNSYNAKKANIIKSIQEEHIIKMKEYKNYINSKKTTIQEQLMYLIKDHQTIQL